MKNKIYLLSCMALALAAFETKAADAFNVGYRLNGEVYYGQVKDVQISFLDGKIEVKNGYDFKKGIFEVPETGGFSFSDVGEQYLFCAEWIGGSKKLVYVEGLSRTEFKLTGVGAIQNNNETSIIFDIKEQ